MNRRGFLGAILAAGVAPYVMSGGIGRGVLMPVTTSQKIVFPTIAETFAVSSGNPLLTIDLITQEALLMLQHNLLSTLKKYDKSFFVDGSKILQIKKPLRYRV